jgi:hypothetical protein
MALHTYENKNSKENIAQTELENDSLTSNMDDVRVWGANRFALRNVAHFFFELHCFNHWNLAP